MRPSILKVLGDAGRKGVTAANLSSKDITDAIGIVERRLNGIKHGDIVLADAQTKKKKYKNAKTPIIECIPLWLIILNVAYSNRHELGTHGSSPKEESSGILIG
ncbi:MAG: hypothetical protein ACLPY1_04045 [Terracidiphilus sp.]